MTENEHVKLGAYHTLEIELQRPFSLYKQSWDVLDLDRIKQACDPAASADLAAVLITVRISLLPFWLADQHSFVALSETPHFAQDQMPFVT